MYEEPDEDDDDEELDVVVLELTVDVPESIGKIYGPNGAVLREVRRRCGFIWR